MKDAEESDLASEMPGPRWFFIVSADGSEDDAWRAWRDGPMKCQELPVWCAPDFVGKRGRL
jgi:hypothetical protein